MTSTSDFFAALDTFLEEQNVALKLSDGTEYKFKLLSTSQLKDLIKTVVDSPVTLAQFNLATSKVMQECLVEGKIENLTAVDRLLWLIETRISSLGDNITMYSGDDEFNVDLKIILSNLKTTLETNPSAFQAQTITDGAFAVSISVPTMAAENRLTEEVYTNLDFKVETPEELRTLLGDTFLYEITKCVRSISLKDKTINLDDLSFADRIKAVEKLPATLSSKIISFVETYKKLVAEALVIEDDLSLPIDGTLFTLR